MGRDSDYKNIIATGYDVASIFRHTSSAESFL